jgi:hypothetical protein
VDLVVGTRATASLRSSSSVSGRRRVGRHTADVALRDDSIRFAFDRIRRDEGGARRT